MVLVEGDGVVLDEGEGVVLDELMPTPFVGVVLVEVFAAVGFFLLEEFLEISPLCWPLADCGVLAVGVVLAASLLLGGGVLAAAAAVLPVIGVDLGVLGVDLEPLETEGGGVFLDRGTFLVGVVVEGDFHSEAILLTALGRWPGLVEEVTGVLGSGAFATGTAGVVVVVEAPGLS